MKTPRRRFLQTTALAGAAAACPPLLSSCVSVGDTDAEGGKSSIVTRSPREIIPFDDGWKFYLGEVAGAHEAAFDDKDWRALSLPHDFSIEQPFDPAKASCAGYLPGGIGWYRNTFLLTSSSPLAARSLLRLCFDGIYNHSEVWLNGQSLGKRPYGYISFEYVLPRLKPGANTIAVRVDHSEDADTRWYNGSGIYRHVSIVANNENIYIPTWGTFVTTPSISDAYATVSIATRVRNDSAAANTVQLLSIVRDEHGAEVTRVDSIRALVPGDEFAFQQNTRVANPRLWSPDTPYLFTLVQEVRAGGVLLDRLETPFGVRSFEFDAEKGFHLNGVKTLIKGVCFHHDAGCLGAAFIDRAWERRLQLLKDMGCNAIRCSHNPPAPQLLDMCDRMGFLVMDEAFDEWARPKKKWISGRNNGQPGSQGYAKDFKEWSVTDIKAMVERDKNHPSIILWSIGNELDYPRDPYYDPSMNDFGPDRPSYAELPIIAAKLVKAVKEVDTTRPVTAALANINPSNQSGYADLLDVVGYNYQEANYRTDHERYPKRKLIGSENSLAYNTWKSVENLPYASGQFLWTGIDFIGEAGAWPVRGSGSGLLDECGFKKPQYYFRQSLWSAKPMVYLTARAGQGGGGRRGGPGGGGNVAPTWTLPLAEGAAASVTCYSNCEQVELFLNGKSLGEKTMADAQNRTLTWPVPYSAGTLKAVGKKAGAEVCNFELKTANEAKRIVLSSDAQKIAADGRSIAHIEVSVADDAGTPVYAADHEISFEITGPGKIIGLDSGDLRSHESFKSGPRKAFHGKCLVIVQANRGAGAIKLIAKAQGLDSGQVTITAEKPA